jgi:hypothetical protein
MIMPTTSRQGTPPSGHLVGRQVVNNYHRYAKLKMEETKMKHDSLPFSLHYL